MAIAADPTSALVPRLLVPEAAADSLARCATTVGVKPPPRIRLSSTPAS